MSVGQLRQMGKSNGLVNGRLATVPAVMTEAMRQESRTKRNRLALTPMTPVPFSTTMNLPVTMNHPVEMNLPATMDDPVATTPITVRTKKLRLNFLSSEVEAEEEIYDIMANENNPNNALLSQVVADTIGLDTPAAIKKVIRCVKRWKTTALAPSNGTD
jgi:hypothetical protein